MGTRPRQVWPYDRRRPALPSPPSDDDGAQQEAPGWRVLEQGRDEFTVVIEGSGAADERHDAVRSSQLEQRVDVFVAETVRHTPEQQLPAQLGAEALAPPPLV